MRGAFLITIGAFISRFLGALYRPAAQIFLDDKGLALVTPPNAAYQIILAISSAGLNVAISRLVSERLALEDYRGARRVVRVATTLLLWSGLFFSLLFALSANWLASMQGFPEAAPGFLVLAPAILLVTLEVSFRGLYQGMQQMQPSAVSQVIEQAARVGLGTLMVMVLSRFALNLGAAGFNAGNTAGVLVGALYCLWIYVKQRPMANWTTVAPGVESWEHESFLKLSGRIMAIALPLSFLGAVLPLTQFIDSSMVANRLMAIGIDSEAAKVALAYLANASTLRDLPPILTTALYVSLVPAIAECMAVGKVDQARYRAATAFRLTWLIGLPTTVGLALAARDAYGVLYKGPGYLVMAPLAWSTLFLMLQQTSSGVLQGLGLIWVSVRNQLLGVAVKVVLTYWWVGVPALGANGAAYATLVGFLLATVLNLMVLRQQMGLAVGFRENVLGPLAASAIMGVALLGISPLSHAVIHANRLAGLVTILLGGLVFAVAVFALGGVTEADLHLIPGVTPGMIQALKRLRLLRA